MIHTRLKKDNVLLHFSYSWWAYALMAGLMIFAWQMAYSATKYVPPADKTIQVTIAGDYVSETVLEYYEQKAYEQFPEMELITFDNIPLDFTGEGDYSGYTKLQVVVAVGEGDVYLMNKELLKGFASIKAFKPLDEEVAQGGALYGIFSEEEIAAGTFVADDTDGEAHVYGISAARLYGMLSQGVDTRNLYLTCTSFSENTEYALKMIAWLGEQTKEERPAWLDDLDQISGEDAPPADDLPQIG
jgi:hypothetical protein